MNNNKNKNFAILGLGRFGISIVENLSRFNVNILACDKNEARIHEVISHATHVVQTDISDEISLKSMGLANFDVVIIAMGEQFETSLVATTILKEIGAKKVIVKAKNLRQKRILERIGADEVILPEHEMGAKIARKLTGSNIIDILDESDYYTISEIKPKPEWIGKTIKESDIRNKYNYLIIAIRSEQKLIVSVSPDKIIKKDDILIVLTEN